MEPRPDSWLDITDIDVLVLGTGVLHSLVAWYLPMPEVSCADSCSALARAGKRVVHFDQYACVLISSFA